MITKSEARRLKKYRHLLAAMIDDSLGYLTPKRALHALENYKRGEPTYFEWYMHMCGTDGSDEHFIEIGHEVVSRSFKWRHRRKHAISQCLAIVDRNIQGDESLFASYF